MDARLDLVIVYNVFFSKVNIIRNAGGSARDALRSFLLFNHLLGTREIMVVEHTRYGLLKATNEMAKEVIRKSLGYENEALTNLEKINFFPIADLKEAAREDIEFLKENKLILKEVRISGWVQDIDTGRVAKVAE
jgi:carbonic anhydrase